MKYKTSSGKEYDGLLSDLLESITPSPIIYKTNKIEFITYDPEEDKVWHKPATHKPEGFAGW